MVSCRWIESLLITTCLLAFIAHIRNRVVTHYSIFSLCCLISAFVALRWLLLSYYGCHYLVMALITLLGCYCFILTGYFSILAIIMIYWPSALVILLSGSYGSIASVLGVGILVIYYRFICRNLVFTLPPFYYGTRFYYRFID